MSVELLQGQYWSWPSRKIEWKHVSNYFFPRGLDEPGQGHAWEIETIQTQGDENMSWEKAAETQERKPKDNPFYRDSQDLDLVNNQGQRSQVSLQVKMGRTGEIAQQ